MGTSIRLFLIDHNEFLHPFPMAQLGRLIRFDKRVALPEYAGKRIRCAMAILEMAGRKVLGIKHIDYFMLPFDGKGRIDKKEWTRRLRVALELPTSILKGVFPEQVIDARHRFIKRRYDHEFKWKPSPKVEEAIVAAVFG
jgi:hypothetical protein